MHRVPAILVVAIVREARVEVLMRCRAGFARTAAAVVWPGILAATPRRYSQDYRACEYHRTAPPRFRAHDRQRFHRRTVTLRLPAGPNYRLESVEGPGSIVDPLLYCAARFIEKSLQVFVRRAILPRRELYPESGQPKPLDNLQKSGNLTVLKVIIKIQSAGTPREVNTRLAGKG